MIVHGYNEDGFYIGPYECQESPLEPGVFLIPPLTTEISPPEHKDGYFIKFINGKWQYIVNQYAIEQQKAQALSIKNEAGIPINILDSNGNIVELDEETLKKYTTTAKKNAVRKMREQLLDNVDVMVNKVILYQLSSDKIELIKKYRQDLLDMTTAIDCNSDIDKIVWPQAPLLDS